MKREPEVRYYSAFTDDFSFAKEQNYTLPVDYRYERTKPLERLCSAFLYGLALAVSFVYCRFFLHMRIKNAAMLKKEKGGAFIYGNHTQPVGDVFTPAHAAFPKRIYSIVSPANLSIPVIGKLLPYLGAIPLSDTVSGMRKMNAEIERRIQNGNAVVIYPEAHVWEYYTEIRPFSDASFRYPAKLFAPVYAMTVTYQKRKRGKPYMTVYIDGPFLPDESLDLRERSAALHSSVYTAMQRRTKLSDIEYIKYEKAK